MAEATTQLVVNDGIMVEMLITVLLAGLFLLNTSFWRNCIPMYSQSSARFFFLYYIYGAFSAIWSEMPLFSVIRATQVLVITLGVGMYMSASATFAELEGKFYRLLAMLLLMQGLLLLKSIVLWGYIHNVALGGLAAFSLSYILAKAVIGYRDHKYLRYIGVLSVLFILSTSAGAIVALIVSIFLASLLTGNAKLVGLSVSVLTLFIVVYIFSGFETVIGLIFPGKDVYAITTGTGRLELWEYYWELFLERPLHGYGFAVGARMCEEKYTVNTHNWLFAASLGMGIPGLALLLLYVRNTFYVTISLSRTTPLGYCLLTTFLLVCINNMSYPYIGEGWSVCTIAFAAFMHLIIYIEMHNRQKRPYSSKAQNPYANKRV